MTVDYREVLQGEVERLLPTHRADVSTAEWEPQSIPEPCERCGTRVVVIFWKGERRWCEVTAKNLRERIYGPPGNEKSQLPPHTARRCSAAREALSEPQQLDMLTGEPA